MELSVDSEVGTIVWVRRRNGSWWPGKILGGEELSASHLMSPRSGTPVKLLGREDASVDWYNLEKSKRVKPFRCGEFDHCIQRAQASQGMPPKKREKYARREDAILHALDLEKQLLHNNKYPTPVPLNSKPPLALSPQRKRPRLHDHDEEEEEDNKELIIQLPTPNLPLNTIPLQEAQPPLLLMEQEDNKSQVEIEAPAPAPALSADDSSDHTPDHLLKPSAAEDQSIQLLLNKETFVDYNQTPISDWVQVSTPNAFPPFALSEENNTTEDDDQDDDDEDEEDDDEDEEEEDTETDSSGTESVSSDTYDATLSDDGDQIEFIPKVFGRSAAAETGGGGEDEDESMSDEADESDEESQLATSVTTTTTVSKWQLKGKRNTRSLMKRRYRTSSSSNDKLLAAGSSSQWMSYKETDSCDKRVRSHQAIGGFNIPTTTTPRDIGGLDTSSSHNDIMRSTTEGYHDSTLTYMNMNMNINSLEFGGRMKSSSSAMLIDVEVQVQSGYQREHVPMISLMSKLNDKAIVGHPIPVETMQDGSSHTILLSAAQTSYEYQTESSSFVLLDPPSTDDTGLQPWRTARRTAKCRVPRPPSAQDDDEYDAAAAAAADEERKHNNNRKGGSLSRKWPSPKLQKKAQKRSVVLSHSQKIRTLSSIGGGGGGGDEISDLRAAAAEEGLMKPAVAPVACIPVKLVFSRLHEELLARHQ